MKNAELLLMSGGDPYAEATHWLTVEQFYISSGSDCFGFIEHDDYDASKQRGELSPRAMGGNSVAGVYDVHTASSGNNLAVVPGAGLSTGIGNYVFTNLIDGNTSTVTESYDSKFNMYSHTGPALGLDKYIGQKIPLKIVKVS